VVLGLEAGLPDVIPEHCQYREYFAPTYETVMPKADLPKEFIAPHSPSLRRRIMNNLDKLKHRS